MLPKTKDEDLTVMAYTTDDKVGLSKQALFYSVVLS